MSESNDTGLDLEQLFLPAWAQQSSDVNRYADFTGEPESGKIGKGRNNDRRRGDFKGNRPPRSERPLRKNGESRPKRNDEANTPEAVASDKAHRSERKDRPFKNQGNHRGNRNGFHRRYEDLPPLPEVGLQLVPDPVVVETLARQIHQSGRAYPLFEIAHIILKRLDRLSVTYSVVKKAGDVVQPLFFCNLDRTLWLSEEEAMEHVFKAHFANFYETEKVPIDGPKGTYTFVAQCGMSGIVLGPPNLHDYQAKLTKLHSERFPNVPFDIFKSRIQIVKDPEIIEKWKEEMSYALQYKCLQVPEPLTLQDMQSVKEHFRQTHLSSVIQSVDTITLSPDDLRNQPNRIILALQKRHIEEQKRFPLKLVTLLSQKFSSFGLQFFKVDKTVTHVSVSRPRYLDLSSTSVSENVKNIQRFVSEHPDATRNDLYEALIPGYKEVKATVTEQAPATETAETTEDTQPVLPPEVASALSSLNDDLHWLINCGHLIEFYKGNLVLAPKAKTKPPISKNSKENKKSDKQEQAKPEEAPAASEEVAPAVPTKEVAPTSAEPPIIE